MVPGRYSNIQRSLLVLLPSAWYPAVAHPHKNFSGNALLLSATFGDVAAPDCANDRLPSMFTTAAAEAPWIRLRRVIVFAQDCSAEFSCSLILISHLNCGCC